MPVVADNFSPVTQGNTGAKFAPQFLYDDGSPYNLSGATITSKMQLVSSSVAGDSIGTVKTCAGTWFVDSASTGQTHYQYASTDLDTPGTWNIYIYVTIGGLLVNPDGGNGIIKQLVILPSI